MVDLEEKTPAAGNLVGPSEIRAGKGKQSISGPLLGLKSPLSAVERRVRKSGENQVTFKETTPPYSSSLSL